VRWREMEGDLDVEAETGIVHGLLKDAFPPPPLNPARTRTTNLPILFALLFLHHQHLPILIHPFRINTIYPTLVQED